MASFARLSLRVCLAAALGSCLSLAASAQSPAGVEGRAVDAAGTPIRNAVVRLIADPRSHTSTHPWRYTLMADSVGKFSQGGLAPGAYLVMVYSGDRAESVWRTVSLAAGATTRLELQPLLSPEQSSTMGVSSRTFALAR